MNEQRKLEILEAALEGLDPNPTWNEAELALFASARGLVDDLSLSQAKAPQAWINRAVSLMPGRLVRFMASLRVQPQTATRGGVARQVEFEAPDFLVRLELGQDGQVRGRLPEGWEVTDTNDQAIEVAGGRFSTQLASDEVGLIFSRSEVEVALSAEALRAAREG
jgi:hypothetical protein